MDQGWEGGSQTTSFQLGGGIVQLSNDGDRTTLDDVGPLSLSLSLFISDVDYRIVLVFVSLIWSLTREEIFLL